MSLASVFLLSPLIVFAAAPLITLQPANQTVSVGETLTLTVTAADATGYQ
jgi:uncharacterized protein YjdB